MTTDPSSPYISVDDPRIVAALRAMEHAVSEQRGNGWVKSKIDRKDGYVMLEVVCTFRFEIGRGP